MKFAALIAGAAALGGSMQHTPLSDRDFQQLMEAAAAASASSWKLPIGGNGIVWVFKKRNGKWTQVAEAVLWFS